MASDRWACARCNTVKIVGATRLGAQGICIGCANTVARDFAGADGMLPINEYWLEPWEIARFLLDQLKQERENAAEESRLAGQEIADLSRDLRDIHIQSDRY